MKRLLTITCALALAMGAVAAPAMGGSDASIDAAKRGCNSINLGGPKVFYKTHIRCARAKRYARRVYNSGGENEPRNFNCTSGSNFVDGANCQHETRNKSFGWYPAD